MPGHGLPILVVFIVDCFFVGTLRIAFLSHQVRLCLVLFGVVSTAGVVFRKKLSIYGEMKCHPSLPFYEEVFLRLFRDRM